MFLRICPKFAAAFKEELPMVANIKTSVPIVFGKSFIKLLAIGNVFQQAIGKPIPTVFDRLTFFGSVFAISLTLTIQLLFFNVSAIVFAASNVLPVPVKK
ncbi:hypothetical protein AGMMS50233_02710 [Endomicrobiia bacterium]|nr:hypothetical protein AGMMS50233_02710 [Endomicrobiia bacterium]